MTGPTESRPPSGPGDPADKTMQADMGNVGLLENRAAVEHVVSADGTRIAFQRCGEGPPLVIVGGGLNARLMFGGLAAALGERFTVFNYDRRGRGDSGDGDPQLWTIEREIADLAAVVEAAEAAAGPGCAVFANCTGGMIAVLAAARGVPIARLALYEPPYCAPPPPSDFLERLTALIEADRRTEAVVLFQLESVGFPPEAVEQFQANPIWPVFESMAPTLRYDCLIDRDHGAIPFAELARITAPTLVIDGSESAPYMHETCAKLVAGIPGARHERMRGEGHLFNQKAGAPILADFLAP